MTAQWIDPNTSATSIRVTLVLSDPTTQILSSMGTVPWIILYIHTHASAKTQLTAISHHLFSPFWPWSSTPWSSSPTASASTSTVPKPSPFSPSSAVSSNSSVMFSASGLPDLQSVILTISSTSLYNISSSSWRRCSSARPSIPL